MTTILSTLCYRMKLGFLSGFFCLTASLSYGQNAVADLHFERAEKAYNEGNYQEVLAKLDEVERLEGVMSKTLFLRIVTQEKMLEQADVHSNENSFDVLTDLRNNSEAYLEAMVDHELDERYREVYRIKDMLNRLPKTSREWNDFLEQREIEKKEQEEQDKASKMRLKEHEAAEFIAGKISINQLRYNELSKEYSGSLPDNDVATVYFIRTRHLFGSLVPFLFYMNSMEITSLGNKQHTVKRFSQGLSQAKVRMTGKGGGVVESNNLLLHLKAGNTYYVKTVVEVGEITLELLDEKDALVAIKKTKKN